jgi:hypothetical protein
MSAFAGQPNQNRKAQERPDVDLVLLFDVSQRALGIMSWCSAAAWPVTCRRRTSRTIWSDDEAELNGLTIFSTAA